jgi:hypothetical protein
MNIYIELTRRFNAGRLRAILAGGQAVVLHRLAIMSKDGDWILREDEECLSHILSVLGECGARYRFGAPLDVRWLSGGWSSHFEFMQGAFRVRTDFVTRPPRLDADALDQLWKASEKQNLPFVGLSELALLKQTNREKDYAVIGELARQMTDLDAQILYSRSARDLMRLASEQPEQVKAFAKQRPALLAMEQGREALEAALDAERRRLIHANEERLAGYMASAERWAEQWPRLIKELRTLPLAEAHRRMVECAQDWLPFRPVGVSR